MTGSGPKIQRRGRRLSYANVTATLALIVALGGTSYAAFTLPRNSVGARQIRTGAVRSKEVRDRSLGVRDLSATARSALRGAAGPAGAQGPVGQVGPAAAEYFAAMQPNGIRVLGNATYGGNDGVEGRFKVGFARSVAGCAATATVGTIDTSSVPPGFATVGVNADGSLAVHTYDANGKPTDLPFHVIVAC